MTIISGPHVARNSLSARNMHAKEARNPPQAHVYKAAEHLTKSTRRELEATVFTEVDTRWVHHPHTDALVITVGVANSNVHRMLVDNNSAVDILYWDAYKRMGLTESDLSPMASLLY